ncbi:TetR/AcrR family transcriptional regulator [Rhodopseudomonas palustris]|uniref:TetR/AcrR family transcriptional regulator n=1 Tax=Rhodopseudomonas palustris TaxID=1076 RepID=UPI002ACDF784|nr:TetR/AcrR family transcriptional regulator [Rhodopseudomonas palustris]WQH00540.1 TetR/AcrR family transcriptional regulator [Rhodopseudomonas palustris]
MSNSDKPRPTRARSTSGLPASPSRQKLQSRRNSSTEPTYAPRRTQAERSETTRTQLIDAAIKLVRANGLSGLRTVEVAELAGVSRGALMHHFKSKHDLTVAVIRHVNDISRSESARRATIAKRSDQDPIEGIIHDAHDFYFGDYFFIELAIAMSADSESRVLKRETLRTSRTSRFSVEAAWLEALMATGISKQVASDVLALTLSVVRGFSVRMLIERDPDQFAHLLKVWRNIIRHYLDSMPTDRPIKRGSK